MATLTKKEFCESLVEFVDRSQTSKGPWTLERSDQETVYGRLKVVKLNKTEIEMIKEEEDEDEELKVIDKSEFRSQDGDRKKADKKLMNDASLANEELINNHLTVKMVQFDYQIMYSESYSVPVLYFRAINDEGKHLKLEEVWRLIPNVYHGCPQSAESPEQRFARLSSMITQCEHPITGLPCYWIHPCQTATMMAKVSTRLLPVQSSNHVDLRSSNYIMTWLSSVGPLVGLELELDFGLKFGSANPTG